MTNAKPPNPALYQEAARLAKSYSITIKKIPGSEKFMGIVNAIPTVSTTDETDLNALAFTRLALTNYLYGLFEKGEVIPAHDLEAVER